MPDKKRKFSDWEKELNSQTQDGIQNAGMLRMPEQVETKTIEEQPVITQPQKTVKPPQKTEAPLSDYDIVKQRWEAARTEMSAFEQHRQRLNELDKETTEIPKEQYEYKGVTEGEYGAYIGQQKEKEKEREKEQQRITQGIKEQGIEFIKQERLKKQYEEQQKIKDLQQNLNPDIDKKIKEYEEKQPSYFDQFSLIHKRAKDEDEQLHYDVVSELYDNDRRNYNIAKTILQDTKSLLNAPTKTEGGDFFKAAGNELKQLDTWLTISGLADNLQKSSVVKFAQTGKPLTKSEEALLDAIFDYYYVSNERAGNISKAYAAGQMAGKSIPFMLDFVMTGGFASGAVGDFGKVMAKHIEKKLINEFGEAAYKKLTKTGVDRLIKAPFMAAEESMAGAIQAPMTPTFYSSVTEEVMPKPIEKKEGGGYVYQQGTPIKVAIIRGMNEVIFERWGGFIGDVFSPLGKALTSTNYFNKIKSTKLKNFNRVLYGGNGTFAETLKKTGYNGIPLQMGEEVFGQLANYVEGASTKEEMDEFFSKDNFQIMLMGFAPMTGVSVAGNMAQRGMINYNHKKATANINKDFGDKALDVISALNETSPDRLDDIFDEIMLNNDGYEGNKLTDKGKVMAKDMLRYVYTKAQVESVKGIDQDNYKATGAPKNAVNEMQDGKHTVALLDAQGNIIVQKQFENEDAAEKYKQKLNEMYMTPNNEVDKQINEGLNTLSQQTVTKLNALKSNQKNANGEDIIVTSVVSGLSNDALGVPNGTEVYIKADNGKQSIVQYVDNNELKKAVIPNENLTNKTEELVSDMFFQYMDIASKTMYKTSAQSNQLIMEGLAEEDNMTTHDYSNKKAGHKIKYDGKEAVILSVDTDNDGNKYADIELEDGAIVKAVPLRSVKNPKTVTFNIGKQQIELSKSNETGYFQTDILSKEKAETVKNGIQINSDYIAEIKEQPNPANPIEKGYRVTVREKTEEEKQDKNAVLNAFIADVQANGLYTRDKEGAIQIIDANEIDVNELTDKGELRITDKETGLQFVIPLENQQDLREEYQQLQQQPEKEKPEAKTGEKPIREVKPETKETVAEPTYTELFEQTKEQYGYDTAIQDIKDEISSKETQLSDINETIKSASMKEKAVLRGQAQAINIELTELNNILKTQEDAIKERNVEESNLAEYKGRDEGRETAETSRSDSYEQGGQEQAETQEIVEKTEKEKQSEKEVWEMTIKEILQLYRKEPKLSIKNKNLYSSALNIINEGMTVYGIPANEIPNWEYVLTNHKKEVEQAISEGKPVPEEVLKDYPELIQQIQKQAETVTKEITDWETGKEQQPELKPTGEQLSLFSTTSLDQSLTDLSSEERVKIVQDAIEQINDGKKVIIIDDMFSHLETKFKDSKVILERINNLRKINGDVIGFTIGDEITLNSNQATINQCIAAFEHERQHVENKEDKAWNDIKNDIAENIDNETLQKEVSALSGNSFYEGLSNNVLADEYIAYVIQMTFEGKEIKSSLKYKNIIQDEYRKRNGERLSILGRGTYPNIDAERRIGQNIVDNETGEYRFLGSVSEGQEREINERFSISNKIPIVEDIYKDQIKVNGEWYSTSILENWNELKQGDIVIDLIKTPILEYNDRYYINPKYISDEQWNKINYRLQQIGFEKRDVSEWKNYFIKRNQNGIKVPEHKKVFKEVFDNYFQEEKPKSKIEINRKIEEAIKYFGTTENFNEAGYLTINGEMLDFSGKKEGGEQNIRNLDHREIQSIEGVKTDMVDFMADGNIRMQPESGGIDITKIPTKAQEKILIDYFEFHKGKIYVDFSEPNSYGVKHSVEYFSANPIKILNDIKRYYNEGYFPQTDIRFATAPTSDIGFYSTVENALLKIKQDKGTKEQFKVMLLNNGAKQAELEWMGFDELPEKLTKADIQNWIDENKIEVKETQFGKISPRPLKAVSSGRWTYNVVDEETGEVYLRNVSMQVADDYMESRHDGVDNRNPSWQLPGGENYKEWALYVPTIEPFETSDFHHYGDVGEGKVVVWVRGNERTDSEGNRVLFLEEIQSKRAQEGKKEGFGVPKIGDIVETYKGNGKVIDKFENGKYYVRLENGVEETFKKEDIKGDSVPDMPFKKTDQWVNLVARRMMRYAAENGFDRIAWTNGEQQADRYDLSKQVDDIYTSEYGEEWTNRGYEKRKDVEITLKGGEVKKLVVDDSGKIVSGDYVGERLENVIGKEITEKILSANIDTNFGQQDLKVGGEGMKGFYDGIVPSAMSKLGKPFGAKVENVSIKLKDNGFTLTLKDNNGNVTTNQFDSKAKAYSWLTNAINNGSKYEVISEEDGAILSLQQSIPITEEMKESVMQGIPLFAINLSPQQRKLADMLNEISVSEDVENAEESTNYRKAYIERYKALKDKLNAKNPNIVEIYQDVLKYLEALANDKTWSKWDKSAKPQLISIRNSVRELKKAGSIYGLKKKLEKALEIVLERQNETARKIIDNFVNQKLEGKKGKGVVIPKKVDAITRQFFDSMKEWMNKDSQSIENKLQNLRVAFNQKKEGNERDIIESQIKALTYIQNYKENITKQEDTISNIIIDINRLSKEYTLKDIRKDISSKYNTIASNKKKLDKVDERGKVDIIEANINLKKEIEAKQNEYKSIKQDIKLNKSDKRQLTLLKSLLLEKRISMQNSMESFIKELDTVLKEGIKAKRIFAAKEEAKKQEILKGAYLDLAISETEIIVNPPLEESKKSILHRWLDPKYTFSSMLKDFGIHAPDGRGILYERFFTNGMLVARQKELTGLKEATKVVDEKIIEIFGEGNHISQVQKLCNDFNGAYVTIKTTVNKLNTESGKTESSVQEQIMELRNGQALYIYAISKMNDGIVKLNAMGIDQEQIDSVTATLDPKLIEFIDWAQDEYLPLLREKYNITHLDLFGSQLDQIDKYFPLNIDLSGIPKEIDIEDTKAFKGLPTTATGSILKRSYNKYSVDIQNSDAIETFIDHIQTMEKWNAYAPVIKELNILNSDNTFKKYVNRYIFNGAANQFKDVCAIAVGAYVPQESTVGSILTTATKMYAISKISGRANTSLKQGLGMVQVLGEGNPEFTARVFKNFADPLCLKWCLDNLTLFPERWNGRTGGDDRLSLKGELSFIKSKKIVALMNKASNIGMLPNAAIDLFVSGVMAKSMYETKYNFYKNERGYSEEESISKALKDAEIIYNETQQSAENLWLSKTQKDRTFLSASFSLFNNANFSYGRLFFEGLSTVGKQIKPKGRANLIAFQKARYIAEGRTPEVASKYAKNDVNRALSKGIMQIGLNGYFVQFVWNLGSAIGIMKALQYIMVFMSDDDKEREIAFEELKDDIKSSAIKAVITPVRGLPGGKELESALELYLKGWTLKQISIQSNPLISDTKQAFEGMANGFKDNDWVKIVNSLVRYASGFTGVDLNTIANITYGIYDLIENHENITTTDVLYDLSLIINSPKSEQKFLAISRRDDDTFEDIVNRYIELKRVHQYGAFSPLTKKEDSRAEQDVAKIINIRYYTLKDMLNEYDKAVETYNKFNPDNYIDLYQNASYERASTLKAELEYTAKKEMLDENQMNELKTAIEAMENDESLNEIYKKIKRAAWSTSRKKEPESE